MHPSVLILPGYQGSGETHWQTYWEKEHPDFMRVQQRDWEHPIVDEWVAQLEATLQSVGTPVFLVTHSIGCLVLAHWAASTQHTPILGALIVAPPDPNESAFPSIAEGFETTPLQPLGFPSIIVASSNDPYAHLDYSKKLAEAWGSGFVNVGEKGHINTTSNLGLWQEGLNFLDQLRNA